MERMTREEKQKAIDALKISAPIMAVTQEEFNDYIRTLNKIMDWLEQEPTTKDDLGVDCVARQDVERFIEGFINEYTPEEELEFINLELDGLKHLPPVTPIRPKGHWTEEFNDLEGEVRFTCSCCGKYQLFGTDFCYNCGAKMVEPQEREDKE